MVFQHISVMPQEAVDALVTSPDGIYVDCTLGGGGHSFLLAKRLTPRARIIGIDQDAEALAAAKGRLQSEAVTCRVDFVHDNFRNLQHILLKLGLNEVNGFLFDLGVSSYQIDNPKRGFSYMQDAPLDMRMDIRGSLTASFIVNHYKEEQLAKLFYEYGEERWGKRIAEFIVRERQKCVIDTTQQLVEIICQAIPKSVRAAQKGHPAKRIFQALRIEINDELNILAESIKTAVRHLCVGGKLVMITFHSLEDRIVKQTFKTMSMGCVCPPKQPFCTCNHQPEIKILGKVRTASAEEVLQNPRAKSAKLRIAVKV